MLQENWRIPSGTTEPNEVRQWREAREMIRQQQLEQTNVVVKQILKEIDQAGVLRSMTLDGVQSLLLLLPLTECKSHAQSAKNSALANPAGL